MASRLCIRGDQRRESGCDFISAQGIEAGGHLRGQLSLLPLLEGVLDAVSVPVLATGGMALREASPPYCKQARLACAWVLVSLRRGIQRPPEYIQC